MRVRFQSLTSTVVLLAGLFTLVSLSTLWRPASADARASSYSITMTPSSIELSAPPGGSTSSSFSVVNEGLTNYTMAVSVAPYRVVGDNYNPQFNALPGTTDASQWIHLSAPANQNLTAGKVQSVDFSLNVPAGTAPGGYYAVIFAEAIPPSSAGVTSLNRVGDILYITVQGPVVQSGIISGAPLSHVILSKNLALGALVKDTGGLHFLTSVQITAISILGRTAFQANLQRYVLPQTERLVTASWNNLPVFGIYKINRSATVAGKLQSLPTKWVVIIRPWLLIVIIILVLFIIGLVAIHFIGKPKARKLKRGKQGNVRH